MSLPAFPPYSSETFVNRLKEIELVRETALKLLSGERGVKRTIIFRGTHGVGKTWLALHLHRSTLSEIDPQRLTSLFIRLASQPTESDQQPFVPDEQTELYIDVNTKSDKTKAIKDIVTWIVQRVETTTDKNASLRELSSWLGRDLGLRTDKFYAFVIDSVYEAPWDFLNELETYMLGPLAVQTNVIIVMTGRGQPFSWESPYLRVEVQERYLEPLNESDTQEQLKRQWPEAANAASRVRDLGGGYPGNNYLIAYALNNTPVLDEVIDRLLSVVDSADRTQIRTYLEALCLLDGFLENDILPMLTARCGDATYSDKPISEARSIRDKLIKYDLIRWDRTVFRIDESIRRVLQHYLTNQRKDLAQRLHQQAYDLLENYAKGSKYREHYLRRAQKHCDAINVLNNTSESSPEHGVPISS